MTNTITTGVTLSPNTKGETVVIPANVLAVRSTLEQATEDRGRGIWDAATLYGSVVPGTLSQGDYADALFGIQAKGADGFRSGPIVRGSGKSMGTIVKRCGEAQSAGVTYGSDEWRYLVQRAGSKVVGEALALPRKASVLKALRTQAAEFFAPKVEGATTRKPNTKNGAEKSAEKGGAEKGAARKVETVEDVLAALHSLEAVCHGFDAEKWSKVETAMTKFVADQVARRVVPVTPATVAKVAAKRTARKAS